MKIFKHNLARPNRHGLSVIEVLTSIVVALIGVFGVLAMIPFSVKQTQSGLDQDAATSMARNALSDFEAEGFKVISGSNNRLNWTDIATGIPLLAGPSNPVLCIDPLGITSQVPIVYTNTFPFNSSLADGNPLPPELMMPSYNLGLPNPDPANPNLIPFSLAEARRMFRLTDDLVFEGSDDPTVTDSDLNGPVQIFNEVAAAGGGGGAVPLNRQSVGAVSWCAIAQPIVNSATAAEIDSYKFNVLVFKDRITDFTVEESEMAAAAVVSPAAGTFANPLSSVTIAAPLSDNIRRNDWVMLINVEPRTSATDPAARRTNMAFARVSNLHSDSASSRLTLDGPNFNFATGTTTYIVHLRDVVAVFPRTIKLETLSGWNVSD